MEFLLLLLEILHFQISMGHSVGFAKATAALNMNKTNKTKNLTFIFTFFLKSKTLINMVAEVGFAPTLFAGYEPVPALLLAAPQFGSDDRIRTCDLDRMKVLL